MSYHSSVIGFGNNQAVIVCLCPCEYFKAVQ